LYNNLFQVWLKICTEHFQVVPMKRIEYDLSQAGFVAVLKDWQLKAMQVVWSSPEGSNSRVAWEKVNQMLGEDTISRASVINFLEGMLEMGVLDADDRTGKGGHQHVYKMGMDEEQFKQFIVTTLLESLLRDFPEETKKAIQKIV
jgi:predicted transcriptional regulator